MGTSAKPGVLCGSTVGKVDDGTLCRVETPIPGNTCLLAPAVGNVSDPAEVLAGIMSGDSAFVAAAFRVALQFPTAYAIGLPPAEHARYVLRSMYGQVVVAVARQNVGIREEGGNNRGADVEQILSNVGGSAGDSWCAAFAYTCHSQAAFRLGGTTTCPKTQRAAEMWFDAKSLVRFTRADAIAGTQTPAPGDVFVWSKTNQHGHFKSDHKEKFNGHTGIVVSYAAATQTLTTIEGNTNDGGGTDGNGVYTRTDRMLKDELYGFVRPTLTI